MSLRRRSPTRRHRNRHLDRSTRCRNDVVSSHNDIVLDICKVYNDIIAASNDVVNDITRVHNDIVNRFNDVVNDIAHVYNDIVSPCHDIVNDMEMSMSMSFRVVTMSLNDKQVALWDLSVRIFGPNWPIPDLRIRFYGDLHV